MANIARMPSAWLDSIGNVSIFDDFVSEPLANLTYATVATDTGTAAVSDAVGGILSITPSDGTVADNDEIYVSTINEVFLCGPNRSIEAKARIQYTEANVDDLNLFYGFGSAVAANFLVDDGGGPRTSGSVIGIYKVDGGTVWRCVTRNGSTVTDTVSNTTAGGSAYVVLGISIVDQGASGSSLVTFQVDGVTLKDSAGNDIIHVYPNTSSTEMQYTIGLKNGAATNVETVLLDKWFASQSY
jgi:hypothetical protein